MTEVAAEFSAALGPMVTYVDEPFEEWREHEFKKLNLPDHVFGHILTMARLHAANRYDRLTHDFEQITGRMPMSVREFTARHLERFVSNPQNG